MKCIYNCNTCSNFYSSFPSWNWKISQWNAYTLAELYIQYTCHYEYIVDPHGRIDYGKLIEIQMFRFSVKVTWSWFAILCFGNTPQTKKRKAWDGSAGCESDALSVNIASPEIMWIKRDPGVTWVNVRSLYVKFRTLEYKMGGARTVQHEKYC